jgi:hypothetical protein
VSSSSCDADARIAMPFTVGMPLEKRMLTPPPSLIVVHQSCSAGWLADVHGLFFTSLCELNCAPPSMTIATEPSLARENTTPIGARSLMPSSPNG